MPRIRRQAANLRYILEAPKLELGADERVEIPVLKDIERKKCAPVCPRAVSVKSIFQNS